MAEDRGIDRDLMLANTNVLSAVAVIVVMGLMVIPVDARLLDLLLTFSIAFSLVILMVAVYLKEPLEFSSFPSLLLIVTLFRLALNIASTRLILSEGTAGQVIQSFGDFVVGGNYLIGVIVFTILVVVNFLVVTKGSGRVAEVAARFTLDAMPGKQMAVDADLGAGLISESEARSRRKKITSEAEFFGAMDGASKFVRGDAIAGIIITVINIAAGFLIGMVQLKMSAGDSLARYTILTVGDGLVSQIPALLVSTAAGMVVTRQSSALNLGQALTMQIFNQLKPIYIAAGALFVFALIPGLPTVPFLVLAVLTGAAGLIVGRRVQTLKGHDAAAEIAPDEGEAVEAESSRAEDLFVVDRLELEIGYGLIPLVDQRKGGDLLQRVTNIRKQVGNELGIVIHPIRVRDNLQLQANEYSIKLKGAEVARASLEPDALLAMSTSPDAGEIEGTKTVEPAFNLPAVWIRKGRKSAAEMAGYTIVEPSGVLATHLSELIRSYADELLGRQDVKEMCETVREFAPAIVEEIIPDKVSVNTLHNVLKTLLHERIPCRDFVTILETLANYSSGKVGLDFQVEKVREALHRSITALYLEADGSLNVVSLHPETERMILEAAQRTEKSGAVALPPDFTQEFLNRLEETLRRAYGQGRPPVLLVPTPIRTFMKRLIETTYPNLAVMGYTEVAASAKVQSAGTVVANGLRKQAQGAGV